MLTSDNLFDGTISTNTEHFYVEPSEKYSKELPKSGVHSIIYKLSDVKIDTHNHNDVEHGAHCASAKLHRKMQRQKLDDDRTNLFRIIKENNVNEKSDLNLNQLNSNGDVIRRKKKQSDNHDDKYDVINKRSKRWLSSSDEVSCRYLHRTILLASLKFQ